MVCLSEVNYQVKIISKSELLHFILFYFYFLPPLQWEYVSPGLCTRPPWW